MVTVNFILEKNFQKIKDIFQRKGISEDDFLFVLSFASDYKENEKIGKFGRWLLNYYLNNPEKFNNEVNDLKKLKEYFLDNPNIYQNVIKSIDRCKTINDVFNLIKEAEEDEELSLKKLYNKNLSDRAYARYQKKLIKKLENEGIENEARKITETDKWEVWQPLTEPAACILGEGSNWCFSSNSKRNEFRTNYNPEKGLLLILKNKITPYKSYALFFKNDGKINFHNFQDFVVNDITWINFLKEEDLLDDLKTNPYTRKYVSKAIEKEEIKYDILNSKLSEADIKKILKEGDGDIIAALGNNPYLTNKEVKLLIDYAEKSGVSDTTLELISNLIENTYLYFDREIIERLFDLYFNSRFTSISGFILLRKEISDKMIKKALDYNDLRVNTILSKRPDLPEFAIEKLLKTNNLEFIENLFTSNKFSGEELVKILKMFSNTGKLDSNNRTQMIILSLITDLDYLNDDIKKALYKEFKDFKDYPDELLPLEIQKEKDIITPLTILKSPNFPPELFKELIYNNPFSLYSIVFEKFNFSPEDIEEIYNKKLKYELNKRTATALFNNKNTPKWILQELIKKTDVPFYLIIRNNILSDTDKLNILNLKNKLDILNLEDENKISELLRVLHFSEEDFKYLYYFLRDNNKELFKDLIRNENIPENLLKKYFNNNKDLPRKERIEALKPLIENKKCPSIILEKILTDPKYNYQLKNRALKNPNTPENLLEKYYRKFYSQDIILSNPSVDLEFLKKVKYATLPKNQSDYSYKFYSLMNKKKSIQESFLFENLDDIYKYFKDKIDRETFDQIIKQAPDYNSKKDRVGKFGRWLINAYIRTSENQRDSQLDQVLSYLKEINQSYIKYKNLNLDKLKTFDDFLSEVEKFKNRPDYYTVEDLYATLNISDNEEREKAYQNMQKKLIQQIKTGKTPLNINKIYENNEWFVAQPLDEPAACIFGRGSEWCFASNSIKNAFKKAYYPEEGLLLVFRNKTNPNKSFAFFSRGYTDEIEETTTADFKNREKNTVYYLTTPQSIFSNIVSKLPDIPGKEGEVIKALKNYNLLVNYEKLSDELINNILKTENNFKKKYLAKNPYITDDLIRKLAQDKNKDIREIIVKRNDLPEDVIRLLAQDMFNDIRKEISKKRNLPEDVIRQLAKDEDYYYVRKMIAERDDLPEDVIRQLAQDEERSVRRIIGKRNDLPEDIIRQLAQDGERSVRKIIAKRNDLPKDLIKQLAQDEDNIVRTEISERDDLPKDIIRQLAQDEESNVRRTIAQRDDLSEDLIRKLAQDEESNVRRTIAQRDDLSEDLIRKLAQDENNTVRAEISKRDNLPEDIIRQLAQDKNFLVRLGIANRDDLPEDLIRQLVQDKDKWVRDAVIEKNDLPEDILKELIKTNEYAIRLAIAKKSNLSPAVIKEFVNSEFNSYRLKKLFTNYKIHIPENLLEEFLKEERLKRYVSLRPELSEEKIRELAKDKNLWEYLARNPNLPEDLMRKFFNNGIFEELAKNPNLPDDIIWDLIYKDHTFQEDILHNLVLNKKVNEDQLLAIFDLGYDVINQTISKNKREYSADFLEKIINKTNDINIIYDIAERKHLPERIIRILAKNLNEHVRKMIAERDDLPEDVIRQLAEDKNDEVRKIIKKKYFSKL